MTINDEIGMVEFTTICRIDKKDSMIEFTIEEVENKFEIGNYLAYHRVSNITIRNGSIGPFNEYIKGVVYFLEYGTCVKVAVDGPLFDRHLDDLKAIIKKATKTINGWKNNRD